MYFLYESAVGFALFEQREFDAMNAKLTQIQKQVSNLESFQSICRLKAFIGFQNAESALENLNKIKLGEISEDLLNFLQSNLKKKKGHVLAVQDKQLASQIAQEMQIECATNDVIFEIFRGIRRFFPTYIQSKDENVTKAELGLAHAFSRHNVEFDVNRQDKPIIQAIAVIEQMDKNLNLFAMRVKEWFSWHFPELAREISDNETYIRLVHLIQNRDQLNEELLPQIEEIVHDGEIAQRVLHAANISMGQIYLLLGQELGEIDQQQINALTERVISQIDFKKSIQEYLSDRMNAVAPNLTSLIGENVGAKLISQAGSLTTLAKYPASTIQILGAEKALFRALKTKSATPKYGTLFHSGFISRAKAQDKGRISRYLANKCSIACRIDQFAVKPTNRFGEKMKEQVEKRLEFLESGEKMAKNVDVMEEVLQELKNENLYVDTEARKKKSKKQKVIEEVIEEKPKKKKKVE